MPKNKKKLQSLIGFINCFRPSIINISENDMHNLKVKIKEN